MSDINVITRPPNPNPAFFEAHISFSGRTAKADAEFYINAMMQNLNYTKHDFIVIVGGSVCKLLDGVVIG